MIRQDTTRNLLSGEPTDRVDLGWLAMGLLIIGSVLVPVGAIMTGMAYAYENQANFTSVAKGYGLRTDIAGPVLLSTSGAGLLLALVLITFFQAFAPISRKQDQARVTISMTPSVPQVHTGIARF